MAKVPPFIIIRDTYANVVENYSASADGALAYFTDLQCEGVKCNGAWYPSVLSSVDAVTGVSQLTTYGNKKATPRNLAADGSFTTKRCPYLKTSTATNDAAGYTYQTIAAAEAPFNAVRIGFLNGESSAVTISQCIAGVRGSVTNGAATWNNITFGGASSVTLPARLGTNRPSITYTDWLPLQSTPRNDGQGTLPLFYIRAWIAAAQATFSQTTVADDLTWLASASSGALNSGRVWKTERQNVNAVATPANWTAPTQVTHAMPMIIEFAHSVRGITVLNVGDSIRLGTPSDSASTITKGDAFISAASLSTASVPVSMVNAAWGGDNSANYTARAVDMISAVQPDVVLFAPFTVNDGTPTDYRIAWEQGQLSQVFKAAKAAGAKMILVNGMCNTAQAWNSTADDYRKSLNATLLTMGVPVIDQDSQVTDGATPARFASGKSTDNTHPVAAAYTLIAPLTSAAINKVIFN